MRNFFRRPLVGVDVGSRTVKGVALRQQGGRVAVEKYFFYDLAETAAQYPAGADAAEALRAGVELQALRAADFAASVPDRDVIHLELELPAGLPAPELRTAVKHELAELTGIPAEELAFDFHAAEEVADAAAPTRRYQAYGSHLAHVQNLVHLLEGAALKPKRVESDTLAIAAALEFNGYIEPGATYAVLDLGECHLTAILIANGTVRLSKSFPTGWGAINQLLFEKLGLAYAEAERQKQRYDFNGHDPAEAHVEQAIDEAYARIFSDIKRALELFADSVTTPVDQFLLVGGASQTANLPRVLEMFFKIPAVVCNPFRKIDLYAEGDASAELALRAPHLTAAVGLALSALGKKAA